MTRMRRPDQRPDRLDPDRPPLPRRHPPRFLPWGREPRDGDQTDAPFPGSASDKGRPGRRQPAGTGAGALPQRGVNSDLPDPDYGKVFHLAPVPLVLIALDRTVVDANRAHLESTATTLEAIIGRD